MSVFVCIRNHMQMLSNICVRCTVNHETKSMHSSMWSLEVHPSAAQWCMNSGSLPKHCLTWSSWVFLANWRGTCEKCKDALSSCGAKSFVGSRRTKPNQTKPCSDFRLRVVRNKTERNRILIGFPTGQCRPDLLKSAALGQLHLAGNQFLWISLSSIKKKIYI